ncbi:MAG: MMPL family transporter [Kangiellaceae bacterium]|jgi:predicted RND superfamily exporter protein|nr:MMPL family transporter [Kangiellaceae bacterium]
MESQSKVGHWIASLAIKQTFLTSIILFGIVIGLGIKVGDFRLDASADSLLLENDPSLTDYRKTYLDYGSDDYLFLLFDPKGELFEQEKLKVLEELQNKISKVDNVASVTSVLDIPIFDTSEADIFTVENDTTTLRAGTFDLAKAKAIIIENPIYQDLIISSNGALTAMQINLTIPNELKNSIQALTQFQIDTAGQQLTQQQQATKAELQNNVRVLNQEYAVTTEKMIADIRSIIADNKADVRLFLGGVPMIANDLMAYVQNDINTFGGLIVGILILILTVIFRHLHWIILPLAICGLAVIAMVGLLGWLDWPATVISSNFVALLLIMTLSLTIHLIVRFREQAFNHPEQSIDEKISHTLSSIFMPCLYTAITTMVAFGSLVVSDIRPVKDFGIMMSVGLALAFVVAFLSFPLFIKLFYGNSKERHIASRLTTFTSAVGRWTLANNKIILVTSVIITTFAISGLFKLTVDNRFIDYFRTHTEIYQGMKTIDDNLGGTTPLDIIIKTDALIPDVAIDDEDYDAEFEDDFAEFEEDDEKVSKVFTQSGAAKLASVHQYLEQFSVSGKVLSLTTTFRLLNQLNGGKPLDDFLLNLFYKRMSDDIRQQLVTPYHKDDGSEVHLSVRMIDSHPELKRGEFLDTVDNYLKNELNLNEDDYKITGMFVLYNNMLSSLFDSQIKTISVVFLAILIMFALIFKSFNLALISILPNAIAAAMVLGAMGWFNVPLDMMSITIAAIVIGIGVDDTIHYIFRYRKEYSRYKDYEKCVQACHDSIGKALYYTSLTIIVGFTVLWFSNFIPTITFGVLTSIAMATALLANLTLLPRLIILFKPTIPELPADE